MVAYCHSMGKNINYENVSEKDNQATKLKSRQAMLQHRKQQKTFRACSYGQKFLLFDKFCSHA